jgi:site-specific DNA recombinase
MSVNMQAVIALARVSSEEQASEDRGGLERQWRDMDVICRRENLKIVKRFTLEGISGSTAHLSPEFKAMLAAIAQRDITGLVISSADRLMRTDEISTFSILSAFDNAKKPKLIYTLEATYDLRKWDHKVLLTMRCLMAGNEKSQIIARTQAGKNISRERGDKCADKPPVGVEFVVTDSQNRTGYYRYTAESSRIKQAFARVLADVSSLRSIAADLGFHGYQTMRKQLINPVWIGYREHTHTRERIPTADHQIKYRKVPIPQEQIQRVKINLKPDKPLIEIAIFDRVQEMLGRINKEQKHKRTGRTPYLLAGVLRCGVCGGRYYTKHDERGGKNGYYICSSGYHSKSKACGNCNLKRTTIENTVLNLLSYALCDYRVLTSLVTAALAPSNAADLKQESLRLRAEVETLTTRRNKLVEKVSDGLLTDDEAKLAMAKIRTGLEKATASLKETDERLKGVDLPDADKHIRKLATMFSKIRDLEPEKQREVIRQTVASVKVKGGQVQLIGFKIQPVTDEALELKARGISNELLPIPDNAKLPENMKILTSPSVKATTRTGTGSWRRPA